MLYELSELKFEKDALEPSIDAKTIEIHHGKHHAGYVKKLNAALENHPEIAEKDLMELLANPSEIPGDIRTAVLNNGGGHVNHSLFWEILSPEKQECSGDILEKIKEVFGSFDGFKEEFSDVAAKHFASGWTWLVLDEHGNLEILSMPGHENPIKDGKKALLVLDVWEHAYYLKYQNKRADFIEAFWNIINWNKVNELYSEFKE